MRLMKIIMPLFSTFNLSNSDNVLLSQVLSRYFFYEGIMCCHYIRKHNGRSSEGRKREERNKLREKYVADVCFHTYAPPRTGVSRGCHKPVINVRLQMGNTEDYFREMRTRY